MCFMYWSCSFNISHSVKGVYNFLGSVSSQQKFEAMDVKALSVSQLSDSVTDSHYHFLTCIQISQEAGHVVWYSHLLRIFQFVVIHTVKGFSMVNKAEVDVFLELLLFSMIQQMLAIYIPRKFAHSFIFNHF